jgi:hypothetical protein
MRIWLYGQCLLNGTYMNVIVFINDDVLIVEMNAQFHASIFHAFILSSLNRNRLLYAESGQVLKYK